MSRDHQGPLRYDFDFRPEHFARRCQFVTKRSHDFAGQPFFCRYDRISTSFSRTLTPQLQDLMEVATAAYLADRFAPRRHPERSEQSVPMNRRIRLSLPVRLPHLWKRRPAQLLGDLMFCLAADEWEFTFTATAAESAFPQQSYLLDVSPEREAAVMLFSGGLDSYAGAVRQLCDPEPFHVLVSGYTHNRMAAEQVAQSKILFEGRRQLGHHVAVPYGMPAKVAGIRLESSQRSRSLIHLSIGALTALSLGRRDFSIYENGIGALNLPFDASQSGWEVSRAVHPKVLSLMEELIGEITGEPFQIRTPFLFSTKAESIVGAEMTRYCHGIRHTFSCDRFPNYRERRRQCGVCSSCVLRRLALETAGFRNAEPADEYAYDITADGFVPHPSAAFVLDKFDAQTHRLRQCLDSEQPWLEVSRLFPELREVEFLLANRKIGVKDIEASLLSLYARHVGEWSNFSGHAALQRYLCAA